MHRRPRAPVTGLKESQLADAFDVDLVFTLADTDAVALGMMDALFATGCDDAILGLGAPGRVILSLRRTAPDAETAVAAAVAEVRPALPEGAVLAEVHVSEVPVSAVSVFEVPVSEVPASAAPVSAAQPGGDIAQSATDPRSIAPDAASGAPAP